VSDVDRDEEHTLEDDLAEDDFDDDDDDLDDIDGNRIPAATASAVLEYLARSIVEDPDSVVVDVNERGRGGGMSLEVRVAPGDMGRVIGKRGRVANAIRTIVRAAAARDGVEADVEFED
jgi:predicted RNA-binding protein YlqC (UPF0109 family)